jgi:hypothetical protein
MLLYQGVSSALFASHAPAIFLVYLGQFFLAVDVILIDAVDGTASKPATGAVFTAAGTAIEGLAKDAKAVFFY